MRGVASDEHASTLKSFGNQSEAGRPRPTRQYFEVDRSAYGRTKHRGRAIVGDLVFVLVRSQLGVERELALAVHRRHEGSAFTIERDIHPCGSVRNHAIEIRRAEVDGMHPTAEKIAHDLLVTQIFDSKGLPDRASWSVGADKIGGLYRERTSVGNVLDLRLNSARVLGKANEAPSKVDRNAGKFLGMPAQHLFDEFLRNPMRKFGDTPRTG